MIRSTFDRPEIPAFLVFLKDNGRRRSRSTVVPLAGWTLGTRYPPAVPPGSGPRRMTATNWSLDAGGRVYLSKGRATGVLR